MTKPYLYIFITDLEKADKLLLAENIEHGLGEVFTYGPHTLGKIEVTTPYNLLRIKCLLNSKGVPTFSIETCYSKTDVPLSFLVLDSVQKRVEK
jgi:hypothetical protein